MFGLALNVSGDAPVNWIRSRRTVVVATVALLAGVHSAVFADDVVRRGDAIGDSPAVDLKRALAAPEEYVGRSVIVEGKVDKVCPVKGCWLELMPADETRGVRVKFKDYGFFVPKNSMGWMARLEGKFIREKLSKRQVDHLVGEGATLAVRPDGTANQFSFVARAVELRRPPSGEES